MLVKLRYVNECGEPLKTHLRNYFGSHYTPVLFGKAFEIMMAFISGGEVTNTACGPDVFIALNGVGISCKTKAVAKGSNCVTLKFIEMNQDSVDWASWKDGDATIIGERLLLALLDKYLAKQGCDHMALLVRSNELYFRYYEIDLSIINRNDYIWKFNKGSVAATLNGVTILKFAKDGKVYLRLKLPTKYGVSFELTEEELNAAKRNYKEYLIKNK